MKSKPLRIYLGAAVFAGAGLFSGMALATPIALTNSSFETPGSNNGGSGCPISGWTCNPNNNSLGVYVPTTTQYPSGANGLGSGFIVPDGSQAAYFAVVNGSMSQGTTVVIATDTSYSLSVYVGRRNDPGFNAAISGTIELTANGTAFATLAMTSPAQGNWLLETLTYATTAADSALFGETLGVKFIDLGTNQLNIDDVMLSTSATTSTPTDIPEPGTLSLLGFAVIALGVAGRFRRPTSC